MTSLVGHPNSIPGLTDPSFLLQAPQGLIRTSLFLGSSGWTTTENLLSGWAPLILNRWRINQLSHFFGLLPKPALFTRKLHFFEELCLGEGPIQKSLSTSYKFLLDLHATEDPPFLAKLERDLQVTFTEPQKERILFFTQKSSLYSKYQETTYKIMKRWYRTPSVLSKLSPQQTDRCGLHSGTLLHIFGDCPVLQTFWQPVLKLIHKFTDIFLQDNQAAVLFNLTPLLRKHYHKSLLKHLLTGPCSIPPLWKQQSMPTVAHWLARVNDIEEMEALTSALRDKSDELLQYTC